MGVKIFKGINKPFHQGKTFGQEDLKGIERLSFLEKEQIKGKSFHVAAHIIDGRYVHQEDWHYAQLHKHEFDEINILISPTSCLTYKMECDGTLEELSSPSLIYIPAGTDHRAEPVSGTGIFICIYLDQVSHET
jgi:mannose-6-phosphate isomerase-like protein (cupin superfamily)